MLRVSVSTVNTFWGTGDAPSNHELHRESALPHSVREVGAAEATETSERARMRRMMSKQEIVLLQRLDSFWADISTFIYLSRDPQLFFSSSVYSLGLVLPPVHMTAD